MRRQLQAAACSADGSPTPSAFAAFLERIDRTNCEADHDRYTLERSLRLSSEEMHQLYEELRRASETALSAERDKLQESLATVSATLEVAPDAILVIDSDRRVRAFNKKFVSMWSIPVTVIETNDDAALLSHVTSMLASPPEFLSRVQYLYEHPAEISRDTIALLDGREFDRYSAPITSPDGRAWGRVWFFRDVTSARRAEAELVRLNVFLDSVVENIPDMVFVKNAETLAFERVSRAGEELLGTNREALLGKSDADFFPKEQADFFAAKDRAAIEGRVLVNTSEEPIATHRGTRWLRTKKIPLLGEDGAPKFLLGISADITELKAAREQLVQSNDELERRVEERTEALRRTEAQLRIAQRMEAVGRLAGGVAHDFNNMLAVVLTTAGLILEDLPVGSPLRTDVEEIEKAGQRASSLTRQLLAFSRQQVLAPKALDLNAVVLDMGGMLRRLIGEDVRYEVRLHERPCRIEVDPSQLEQIMLNLAVNARDAMPSGGDLTFATSIASLGEFDVQELGGLTPGPYSVLSVKDTGTGMSEETRARIFDPFFTTKARGQGTGLGLATVYGIVEQSGGHIGVESEIGRGTTFRVYLPCSLAGSEPARVVVPPLQVRNAHETVLLVEDEELVRRSAKRILVRAGYIVIEASNCSEALAIAAEQREPIHLLLSDVIMPGASGLDLAKSLRAERSELRVLFMSGYTDNVLTGEVPAGARFLAKPFTRGTLLDAVRVALDGLVGTLSVLPTRTPAASGRTNAPPP